jgi:DNA-binding PadR family transcriptional regulator
MESIQKLVILGLLKEGPKHGYKIKSEINKIMNIFASWEGKSIYYPLRKMEKEGLLTKSTGRCGRRPEKNIYRLTAEGEKYFFQLLNKSFLTIQRPTFNIDVALLFLPYVKPRQVQRGLILREKLLKKVEKGLKKMIDSPQKKIPNHHLAIIQHNLDLLRAEIKFLSHLQENIQNNPR